MSTSSYSDDELLAWFDERLPVERMAAVEKSLRDSEPLRRRAAALARRRDQGAHGVGEIWRRLRLSCPSRAELGSFLLQTLDDPHAAWVDFHLRTVGCRFCLALFDDLQDEQRDAAASEATAISDREVRRRRMFESSAGLLRTGGSATGADQEDRFVDESGTTAGAAGER